MKDRLTTLKIHKAVKILSSRPDVNFISINRYGWISGWLGRPVCNESMGIWLHHSKNIKGPRVTMSADPIILWSREK